MNRGALKSVSSVEAIPITLEARIRTHLAQLDALRRDVADVEAALSADARRFADEQRITVKPTIPQLRRMVGMEAG